MPERPTTKARQDNSVRLEFDLKDGTVAIPDSSITTATMALLNDDDGSTINGHTTTDVKSSFNALGHFNYMLAAADNPIVDTASEEATEIHVAIISVAATSGGDNITLKEEIFIEVENLKHS